METGSCLFGGGVAKFFDAMMACYASTPVGDKRMDERGRKPLLEGMPPEIEMTVGNYDYPGVEFEYLATMRTYYAVSVLADIRGIEVEVRVCKRFVASETGLAAVGYMQLQDSLLESMPREIEMTVGNYDYPGAEFEYLTTMRK
ncbi:hypothetical protein EBH_0080330 [Eimeria brunetti]|uniref:Uncharacterized protein n=1 Tax=Eimeria brunetti TaxID=51314 RepID=U6LZU7_9EIME|nr:hypothetical protein EBH_0080330 [Eimeria brunetti]